MGKGGHRKRKIEKMKVRTLIGVQAASLDRLADLLAHPAKTPYTLVSGYADLLRQTATQARSSLASRDTAAAKQALRFTVVLSGAAIHVLSDEGLLLASPRRLSDVFEEACELHERSVAHQKRVRKWRGFKPE